MKDQFLPTAENDFVFAFLSNPLELLLTAAAAILFAALLWKLLRKK